jgi:hypothetical protein
MSNAMDSTTQEIIRGALVAWGTSQHTATLLQRGDQVSTVAIHDSANRLIASVRRDASPLGQVWYVGLEGQRERVFPSVVTALRYLRGHLCPEREAGRVLFGQGER